MKTECTERELRFQGLGRRDVRMRFDGGQITSDGGFALLAAVDQRLRATTRFAECFADHRSPERVDHALVDLVRQRIFGIAAGYEDVVDHEHLRNDLLLRAVIGQDSILAGKSTLNRLELGRPADASSDRYRKIVLDQSKVDDLFVDMFVESHATAPEEIVIDLDATDDPIHGNQEGRFFHGYYDGYCYLPLYIFAGDHLLCSRLRSSNIDASAGATDEVERIVKRMRECWVSTRIVLRADSGFCRDALMTWCEANDVDYVFGLARNERLEAEIEGEMGLAQMQYACDLKPARRFVEMRYRTLNTWSRERRVVAKAEYLPRGDNPRFIVTSLSIERVGGRELYEDVYCARGEMENRIKEQQLDLFADRTSAATMRANQMRLDFASMAYVLMSALRRVGLAGTEMARAQCGTIRLRLLKIGARVVVSARHVWVSMSEAYPWKRLFETLWDQLRPAART